MKFELTAETKMSWGVKLFCIRALIDFDHVKAGDLGGWVEKEKNLCQEGGGWVSGGEVSGTALVSGGRVSGGRVSGGWVSGGEVSGGEVKEGEIIGLDPEEEKAIKNDLYEILAQNRAEVPGLLEKLREGKIEGSVYQGSCACLVGTIANIKQCDYRTIGPNVDRPAEQWFLGISEGDTPENSAIAKHTEKWILEFLAQPQPETTEAA